MPDRIADLQAMQISDAEHRLLDPRQAIAIDPAPDSEATATDVFFVRLDDDTLAVWKPLGGVEPMTAAAYGHTPQDTAINEAAAWQTAKRLGEPFTELVPTAVWRELPNVRELLIEANPKRHPHPHDLYSENYNRGVLIEYVPGHPNLEVFDDPRLAVQASDAALFDALIGQQDRHTTNFRWDQSAERLHLIDNGFAFPNATAPYAASVFLQWRSLNGRLGFGEMLPNVGERRVDERAALERLQASGALAQIAGLLSADRGARLTDRCQTMLQSGRLLPFGEFGQADVGPSNTLPPQAREALDLTRMASPRPAREGLTSPPTPAKRSPGNQAPSPPRRPQR